MGIALEQDARTAWFGLINEPVAREMDIAELIHLLALDSFFARLIPQINFTLCGAVELADSKHFLARIGQPGKRKTAFPVFVCNWSVQSWKRRPHGIVRGCFPLGCGWLGRIAEG